jgi:hypothetical protein
MPLASAPMATFLCPRTPATLRSLVALTIGVACGPALAPAPARADDLTDAKDLFERARSLRGHGDCAGAVPLFRKALELYPAGLGSMRNIAECEEALGQFASSRRAWLDLGRALVTQNDPKYEGWADDAGQSAARLAPSVATLTLEVNAVAAGGETASTEGVVLTLNGEPVAPPVIGTPLERDPGRYIVRAAGSRVKAADEQTVELVAGQTKRIVLRVALTGEARQADPAPRADTTRRSAAWVAMGVGAAGLVGAGVSLIVRQSAHDAITGEGCRELGASFSCPQGLSPQQRSDVGSASDRGRTASTLVNVFVAVGALGIGTGAVLFALGRPRTAGTAFVLTPTGVSAVGRF